MEQAEQQASDDSGPDGTGHSLVVERTAAAPAEAVFGAWTDADELRRWWGPEGVTCPEATVDARVGSAYRIVNRLPDGSDVVISGRFLEVARPSRLAFTWSVDNGPEERVAVDFVSQAVGTLVRVSHHRIGSEAARDGHAQGWDGCLAGLVAHLASAGPRD